MKVLSATILSSCVALSTSFLHPIHHHQNALSFCPTTRSTSSSPLPMGLFDFFSEDAKKEREARRQAEIEEQERYQQEILERRKNPAKMEEYEARVRVRRSLRMSGNDEAADRVAMYKGKAENEEEE
mmetsp:Transcript_16613/g.20703  ORF Transcript_16613/g.20703 Transcript_16613/m.20703 type:complete len:127 (+) Transcript_16613:112-492(+)|eukprot:CAMPEP_0172483434 /NCGR_PEP_ID=MMETSP1066-20121228/10451_1 /TAXON_ID=671091 /ORGANISM="Coscinodiscus wailesii, Strain CCMP2513" /LENGTH=126 /DNA_ID=CAMNT_0013247323 /DNA_START=110 /DNA_END=490 /DNA_ORIENTATION=-